MTWTSVKRHCEQLILKLADSHALMQAGRSYRNTLMDRNLAGVYCGSPLNFAGNYDHLP